MEHTTVEFPENDVNTSAPACVGLEIGAVSIKWVRQNGNGETHVTMVRHEGNPLKKLEDIMNTSKVTELGSVVLTGQSVSVSLPLRYRAEAECLEKALAYHKVKPDILLSLGGETFTLFTMKDGKIRTMVPSSKCAAGTGEFIIQQFQRMGFTPEEGMDAYHRGHLVDLSTRCSVFCKSDATHKLNKGECTQADVAKTLIHNLALKVKTMIDLSKWSKETIVVSGGLSLNQPFIGELKALLSESHIVVMKESPYLQAFGASLFASDPDKEKTLDAVTFPKNRTVIDQPLKPLSAYEHLLDFRVPETCKRNLYPDEPHILAVDAGSTTTKAVLYNVKRKTVGAQTYLRTLGNPIQATKNCLSGLIDQAGGKPVSIIQAAATGSAREMVSVFLGNSIAGWMKTAFCASPIYRLREWCRKHRQPPDQNLLPRRILSKRLVPAFPFASSSTAKSSIRTATP